MRGDRLLSASSNFQGDRTIARLVAVLVLSLVLTAPAWAADVDGDQSVEANAVQGDSQAEGAETSGDDSSGTEGDGEVSGSGSEECDPNYEGVCLDPNSEDYDCEGGSGNGPDFVSGPFDSVGDDPFELDENGDGTAEDPNGDGTACEESESGGDSDDESTPSGGVDSGFGGTATQFTGETTGEPAPLSLIAGGVLVALAASGIVVLAARKRA